MKILLVKPATASKKIEKILKNEGLVTDLVTNPEKTLWQLSASCSDLIIFYNLLPYEQTAQLCSDIKKRFPHLAILILADTLSVTEKVFLLNMGADDCMTVPYSYLEILAKIRALTRRNFQLTNDEINFKSLSLNLNNYSFKVLEKETKLTKKEFNLAELFLRHPGRVLNRNEILEKVWDMNADPFSNTIEAHVLNLRKKIKAAGYKKPIIHTVSGIGYKLQ